MMAMLKIIRLQVGAMCGIPEQTCLVSKRNRDTLGVHIGDLLKVQDPLRDSFVTRRILRAPRMELKDDFVFVSPEDLEFLNVDIADKVDISQDFGGIECP